MVYSFAFYYIRQLWLINYVKMIQSFAQKNAKKQHYVYWDYNDKSVVYINTNMALLRVRNH